MKFIDKLKKLSKYSPVICFLALEVFAILAFALGNNIILFGSFSLALFVILVIFSIGEIKANGLSKAAIMIFPLVVLILLICLGQYTNNSGFSTAEIVFIAISLFSIGCCGYLLSIQSGFKVSHFLTVIYSAIAILVFINLIINLINFGPFYTLIYKNYYMYYGGARSSVPVSDIAYALEGFKFIEVQITHYTLYPILLLSSAAILFNLKFKEHRAKFIVYLGFSVLSILALVFVPSLIGLLYFLMVALVVGLIILYQKVKFNHKPLSIIFYILLGFCGVILLIMIFNNQSFAKPFSNFISSNPILNRVFNTNTYVTAYNRNLTDILCSDRFFGFAVHNLGLYIVERAHLTGSIVFDNFMTSGVIGTLLVGFIFVMGFKSFKKYDYKDNKGRIERDGLLAFTAVFTIYSILCADGEYAIFHALNKPTYVTSPFLLVLFIFVFVYCSTKEKGEDRNEISF